VDRAGCDPGERAGDGRAFGLGETTPAAGTNRARDDGVGFGRAEVTYTVSKDGIDADNDRADGWRAGIDAVDAFGLEFKALWKFCLFHFNIPKAMSFAVSNTFNTGPPKIFLNAVFATALPADFLTGVARVRRACGACLGLARCRVGERRGFGTG